MKQNGAPLKPASFIFVLLLGWSSASTLVHPPLAQDFLQYLQLERQNLMDSMASQSQKRSYIGHMAPLYRTGEQVTEEIKEDYMLVPRAIIGSTANLHHGVNCSEFREASKVYENRFQKNFNMRPTWLHRSKTISTCPTQYVERQIQQGSLPVEPKTVLEAKCVCEGSQCADDGSVCVALKYRLPVWIRLVSEDYYADTVELTVACACAKNPSREGGYITLGEAN